jgi:hypothetical protein
LGVVFVEVLAVEGDELIFVLGGEDEGVSGCEEDAGVDGGRTKGQPGKSSPATSRFIYPKPPLRGFTTAVEPENQNPQNGHSKARSDWGLDAVCCGASPVASALDLPQESDPPENQIETTTPSPAVKAGAQETRDASENGRRTQFSARFSLPCVHLTQNIRVDLIMFSKEQAAAVFRILSIAARPALMLARGIRGQGRSARPISPPRAGTGDPNAREVSRKRRPESHDHDRSRPWPLRLRAALVPEGKPMWPTSFGGQSSYFDDEEPALILGEGLRAGPR